MSLLPLGSSNPFVWKITFVVSVVSADEELGLKTCFLGLAVSLLLSTIIQLLLDDEVYTTLAFICSTDIYIACQNGHTDCVKLLLKS